MKRFLPAVFAFFLALPAFSQPVNPGLDINEGGGGGGITAYTSAEAAAAFGEDCDAADNGGNEFYFGLTDASAENDCTIPLGTGGFGAVCYCDATNPAHPFDDGGAAFMGPTGETGPQGIQGEQGDAGPIGPQGDPGEDGAIAQIEEDDAALPVRGTLNFAGDGVTCADDAGQTTCTVETVIPAGAAVVPDATNRIVVDTDGEASVWVDSWISYFGTEVMRVVSLQQDQIPADGTGDFLALFSDAIDSWIGAPVTSTSTGNTIPIRTAGGDIAARQFIADDPGNGSRFVPLDGNTATCTAAASGDINLCAIEGDARPMARSSTALRPVQLANPLAYVLHEDFSNYMPNDPNNDGTYLDTTVLWADKTWYVRLDGVTGLVGGAPVSGSGGRTGAIPLKAGIDDTGGAQISMFTPSGVAGGGVGSGQFFFNGGDVIEIGIYKAHNTSAAAGQELEFFERHGLCDATTLGGACTHEVGVYYDQTSANWQTITRNGANVITNVTSTAAGVGFHYFTIKVSADKQTVTFYHTSTLGGTPSAMSTPSGVHTGTSIPAQAYSSATGLQHTIRKTVDTAGDKPASVDLDYTDIWREVR